VADVDPARQDAFAPSDELSIRAATASDLLALMDLWRELSEHQAPWRVFSPRPAMEEEVRRSYQRAVDDPRSLLLVAEVGGRIVGTAWGHRVVPSSFSDEPAIELSGAIVAAARRGEGVGRALATEIGRFAERQGIRRVVVKTFARNEDALEFWHRIGFEPRMIQMVADSERLSRGAP